LCGTGYWPRLQKHTGQSESFGLFHPERSEVFLLCPDRAQYLQWMEALEGTLINPEALKLTDFHIVTMVGKGSFGQVFQVRMMARERARERERGRAREGGRE
jgi:hypothetical protein